MDIRDAVSYLETLAEVDSLYHTEYLILFHCQLKHYSEFKEWADNNVEIVSQQYVDYTFRVSEEDRMLYFSKDKCVLPTTFILRLL